MSTVSRRYDDIIDLPRPVSPPADAHVPPEPGCPVRALRRAERL